jgi:hypothetical protein
MFRLLTGQEIYCKVRANRRAIKGCRAPEAALGLFEAGVIRYMGERYAVFSNLMEFDNQTLWQG